jgi:endonuclease/exonuclease/phosphatase family metal-dependent hydrolase
MHPLPSIAELAESSLRVVRVVTLNIWNLSGPWRQRRDEIVAWLRRIEPDVVCMQEVVESPDGRNQARWLGDAAGGEWHLAYAGAEVGDVRVGNAVLSRRPIDAEGGRNLPWQPSDGEVPRLVTHARTGGVDVFSTHLNFKYQDGWLREQQVQALVEFVREVIDRSLPYPPVVAGDFNAEPDSTEMRYMTGLTSLGGQSVYFQDAWRVAGGSGPGWTWDNRNTFAAAELEPDRRIDYVLTGWRRPDGAGRVEAARVVCDRSLTGTFASDHFGLCADIADP